MTEPVKKKLPDGWEAFKEFIKQADVVVPFKPFLPVLLEIWECGFKQEIPPDWLPLLTLKRLRESPEYAAITEAEELHGKYVGFRSAKKRPKK